MGINSARAPLALLLLTAGCASVAPGSRVVGGPADTADCGEEGALRTVNARDENSLTFRNELDAPVSGYWLGYDGKRKLTFTLPPGQEHLERTYVSNPWLIATESGRCLFIVPNQSPADGTIRIRRE